MRLWHYKLIHYLPNSQLLAQWRELNSIFEKEDKHILINYIYEYDKSDLYRYTRYVLAEMSLRQFKISDESIKRFNEYFKDIKLNENTSTEVFRNNHTIRYLIQCYFNLEEKYYCKQQDFTDDVYEKLFNFVKKQVRGELFDVKDN